MATTRQRRADAAPDAFTLDDDLYAAPVRTVPADEPDYPDEWAPGQGSYIADAWPVEGVLPDEAFVPDEDEGEWADAPVQPYTFQREYDYAPIEDPGDDDADDDRISPLPEDFLSDEEQAELRRSRWQLYAGLSDFAGVIAGTAVILVLATLLITLINWLVSDLSQSFILLQKNL